MPDYAERIRALRALAAEGSGATEPERKLAAKRADELEAKHSYAKPKSPLTDDTTVTGRDGFGFVFFWPPPDRDPNWKPSPESTQQAWNDVYNLFHNQAAWNKPPTVPEDIVEKDYRYQPNDDEEYDYEGEDDDAY